MKPYHLQGEALARKLGLPPGLVQPGGVTLTDTVLNYLYIPVGSLTALGEQSFDFSRIREEFGREEIVVFCLFTNETVDERHDLHARGLAPNIGVDEDPFTGSMQAGLVHAAKHNGLIAAGQQHISTEQGHFIGRPGSAEIDDHDGDISVTADAVPVFSAKVGYDG